MNTSPYDALMVAGIIFGFVSLMHLLRLIYKVRIAIADKTIPLWVSVIGFIFPCLLSIWMLTASTQCSAATLLIQSKAFTQGNLIPVKYTCHGKNISPPLEWKNESSKTKSFVLMVDDPDAPSGNWNHWVVFNIPPTIHAFSENLILPNGAKLGKNSWGKSTYNGPCPPQGEHRYDFKLYALDSQLNLPEEASKTEVESAMQGHILGEAVLMGRYKK